jgi:hypothetical protein
MPVYDQSTHASPTKLIGQHQSGRASPDDQDIGIQMNRLSEANRSV